MSNTTEIPVPFAANPRPDLGEGETTCIICERAMQETDAVWIHMTESNTMVARDSSTVESQGFFAVGKQCARKVPAAYRFKTPE